MSALITISDIENALGRSVESDEEEAQWQFFIDSLSSFVNNYVSYAFERFEDVTQRIKTNYYGEAKLQKPVVDITSITNFRTGQVDFYIDWDGVDTIYYAEANAVVDVTYSYGYTEVPPDIKQLVVAGVLSQIEEMSPVNLRSHQVGDVRDEYRDNILTQLFGSTAKTTLYRYTDHSFTINTAGDRRYPDYRSNQGYLDDFN